MIEPATYEQYYDWYYRGDVTEGLFAEQKAFVRDPSPLVSAVCSRRAGKTWGVVRKMADLCRSKRGALAGYITKTRDWAEELVWEPLKALSAVHKDLAQYNNAKLRCVYPNGSKIRLAGAKDRSQAEVLRGFGYDLIVIDECGSIDPIVMRYILRDVLPAALGEHRGQLLIVGTPNESCSGYFHDMTTRADSGFSKHHWTQRQNIEFPLWARCDPTARDNLVDEYLASERRKWGYSETDPAYRREYLGEWAKDEEIYVYRITDANLSYPPQTTMRYVLAVDLGYHDMTAWELVGYDQHQQVLYEIDSSQYQHLTFDSIASRTMHYATNYELDSIVIDTAGAGKIVQESLASELSARFGVPCKPAQKTRKVTNMKLLASDFRSQRAYLLPDGVCQDQLKRLKWAKSRLIEQEPDPGEYIDNADAYLYAYRECYHWLHEEREDMPEIGTAAYVNWEMQKLEEQEAEAVSAPNHWWER